VLTRLSRIRKLGEESDVPADDVVGSGITVVQPNRGERLPDPARWSLLLEAKQIELPDGADLDIHHFFLGVEGLVDDGRRSDDRTIRAGGIYPLPMGESYSALTWSGDAGAAVTGMVRREYVDWENASITGRTEVEIRRFYFERSAPDFDLLADIDAWGAHRHLHDPSSAFTVESLLALVTRVYGPTGGPSTEHTFARAATRSTGIRNLLLHCGFTSAANLHTQQQQVTGMEEQVRIIGGTFLQVQKAYDLLDFDFSGGLPPLTPADQAAIADITPQMTRLFLDWLGGQAAQYGVVL